MTTPIIMRRGIAMLVAAIVLLACGIDASAQTRGPLVITNNTNCVVVACTDNGTACATILPGSVTVQIPCNTTVIGIQSCGGLIKVPLGQCVNNVNLGQCCARICFVPGFVGCTFFLNIDPSPSPCPCTVD